jgi:hypothetical protein
LKSLIQYAWEGGEPALAEASRHMKGMNSSWSDIVEWSWNKFAKDSMKVTHNILVKALKRKECVQIWFEDFDNDFDGTAKKLLDQWEISPKASDRLLKSFAAHDFNRLTPEERAKHSHKSGSSLSKSDVSQIEKAFTTISDINQGIAEQRKELGFKTK